MDKTHHEITKKRFQRKREAEKRLVEENGIRVEYFFKIWELITEFYGVEKVFFASIAEFAELASERGVSAFTIADRIAGKTGLLCYREARLQVLYSDRYLSESNEVKNKVHERKLPYEI